MTISEYQESAHSFATYKDSLYPVLGLAEETGEACGKLAKHLRSVGRLNADAPDAPFVTALRKELGDVAWMLSECCSLYGIRLEDVLAENIAKLTDRARRGVICGEGDNR